MSAVVHWFLPTAGDSRDVSGFGPTASRRAPSLDYLAVVARTAEQLGFDAVLTPTGTWCEDAWLTTAALIREATRLRFLVAFRPGFLSPTLAAQQAATFQRLSGGRLLLNIVTGGDAVEQQRFGDWLDHDARYARTDEFLTVVRGAWGERPFDFDGEFYRVAGATVSGRQDLVRPPIFFGGASAAAERVAARHAEVHLTWGEPPSALAERVDRLRALAADEGRELRFGVRLHVIARDRAVDASPPASRSVSSACRRCTAGARRTRLRSRAWRGGDGARREPRRDRRVHRPRLRALRPLPPAPRRRGALVRGGRAAAPSAGRRPRPHLDRHAGPARPRLTPPRRPRWRRRGGRRFPGMKVRRVVTGHDEAGRAVVAEDAEVDPVVVALAPGAEFHRLWGGDASPPLPDAGAQPDHVTYFPPLGGFRFGLFSVPAEGTGPGLDPEIDLDAAVREFEEELPGLAAHMEPDAPGMHTTATVDFEVVLDGEVWLELDDGVEVHLRAGDCVVQNGTRHAWRNHGTIDARLAVFMVGAPHAAIPPTG